MLRLRSGVIWGGVFVAAFLVRLLPVLAHGGLRYVDRYDDGVYYAAADAFTFGRLPYRDYVLLHPPGVVLLLTPFAWLGRLTSDATGLEVARIAMMVLGALSAVGVAVIARRWGNVAAAVAGLLYAVAWPVVNTERATLLEVPAGLCVVTAIALVGRDEPIGRRRALVAGLLIGAAAAFKVWYLAPLVLVLGWIAIGPGWRRGWKSALLALGGAAVAIAAICGPFFVFAPRRMWGYIVVDQARRAGERGQELPRLADFLGVTTTRPDREIIGPNAVRSVVHWHATEALMALLAVALIGCLLTRFGRFVALWFAMAVALVTVSPIYLSHYGALVAPAEVLLLVGGLVSLAEHRRSVVARVGTTRPARTLALGLCSLLAVVSGVRVCCAPNSNPSLPAAGIERVAPAGCIAADSPAVLALMDRLSSDLGSGCALPVDVTGKVYTYPQQGRRRYRRFRRYLRSYLFDSSAFVVWESTGIGSTVRPAIERRPLLYDDGDVAVRAGRGYPGRLTRRVRNR